MEDQHRAVLSVLAIVPAQRLQHLQRLQLLRPPCVVLGKLLNSRPKEQWVPYIGTPAVVVPHTLVPEILLRFPQVAPPHTMLETTATINSVQVVHLFLWRFHLQQPTQRLRGQPFAEATPLL